MKLVAFLISKDADARAERGARDCQHLRPEDALTRSAKGASSGAQGGEAERGHLEGDQEALGNGMQLLMGRQRAGLPHHPLRAEDHHWRHQQRDARDEAQGQRGQTTSHSEGGSWHGWHLSHLLQTQSARRSCLLLWKPELAKPGGEHTQVPDHIGVQGMTPSARRKRGIGSGRL